MKVLDHADEHPATIPDQRIHGADLGPDERSRTLLQHLDGAGRDDSGRGVAAVHILNLTRAVEKPGQYIQGLEQPGRRRGHLQKPDSTSRLSAGRLEDKSLDVGELAFVDARVAWNDDRREK